MNIIEKKLIDLKPYEKNPRKNDEAVEYVANSIKEFGFKVPIVIDKDNVIVCGHTRYKASKILKLKTVPCVVADDLTEEQIKAYRLADNKVSEIATWDFDLLDLEMQDITNIDMKMFNFEVTKELKTEEDDYDVETALEEITEPKAKLGDVYILGNHRLMCGDSTNKQHIEMLMNGNKGKCLFTSPPYNMNGGLYENYTDNLESKKYIDFNMEVINAWMNNLRGYLFWNISYNKNSRWEFIEILYKIVKETGMRFLELIVWDKGHGIPITSKEMLTRQYEDILLVGNEDNISEDMELYYLGSTEKRGYFNKKKGKGITNYWRITTGDTQLKNHKACFPIKLPARAIELTTDEEDIVLEPFCGSGSTLIACEQLNRKCYAMELDPRYVDVIIDRWEKYARKEVVKWVDQESK